MKDKKRKKAKLFSFKYFIYDFIKFTAAIPGLIWIRPKKMYLTKTAKKKIRGGALVISNHFGFFDEIYLMLSIWYRRHHFVATQEFFEGKFKNFLFHSFLCIPIDKNNWGMSSFREIVSHLTQEELVVIFPEGGLNADKSGSVNAFKSGMVLMSAQSGKPIIPVYIKKKKHFYNRVRVAIGEPINVRERYSAMPNVVQMEEISKLLHDKEEELRVLANGGKNEN